jgi:hypothetical protein
MLKLYSLLLVLTFSIANAQPPKMKLGPGGFEAITVTIPATIPEKLVSVTKTWATERERRSMDQDKGYDFTNVSDNTITVSGFKKNAFYYSDRGEQFEHRIRYTMEFVFYDNRYTLKFNVVEIYTDNDVPVQSTLSDYFTGDGTLKEGYRDLNTTLETTVNNMVQSHYDTLINFR